VVLCTTQYHTVSLHGIYSHDTVMVPVLHVEEERQGKWQLHGTTKHIKAGLYGTDTIAKRAKDGTVRVRHGS